MLQAINDRIKGWLGIAIVILIGLPFALWGIQSYLDDAGPRYAAKVNSTEISAAEFERNVSLQRQTLSREYGGKIPVEDKVLRERTLTQLINQRLLEGVTFEKGYRISDNILSDRIKQLFTVDGVFDRVRFESTAAALGMSVPLYEHTLRNELRLKQMQLAIANTSIVTREEVNAIAAIEQQTRDFDVLTFNIEHFSTANTVTEEDIKKYYENNHQRFMTPEKVSVDYVEITSDALADEVVVDEQEIQKMYDDYVSVISSHEQRKARHILLTVSDDSSAEDKMAARKEIESLKQRLDDGEDFSALAKQYSKDPGSARKGGDLGWVSLGEMVKPFEKSLFALKKGSVSNVVESQFGYHLIKLDDVRSETPESLAVKRHEFEDELKADEVASMFFEISERLATISYENPDNLDLVVEELGLKVKSSDRFSRTEGEGIAANEVVRNAAFSPLVLEQGSNSDIIEISPTHVAVIRLNEHIPSTLIPLDTVSSTIENILKIERGHQQTQAAAIEVKTRLESGESIESQVADGIRLESITAAGRNDIDKVSEPAILQSAFSISAGNKNDLKMVDLNTGDVALIKLKSINAAKDISNETLAQIKQNVIRESAIRDFSNILLAIQENADIDKNMRIIDR